MNAHCVVPEKAVTGQSADGTAGRKLGLPRLHRGKVLWDGVHIAKSDADRYRVFNHRYRVYTATRGHDYPGADHDARTIRDVADDGAVLIYSTDAKGEIISSFRIALMTRADVRAQPQILSFIEADGVHDIRHGSAAFLGRMCTSAKGGKDLLRLMMFGYYIGLSNDIKYAFLSARAEFWKLYERLGYYPMGAYLVDTARVPLFLFGANMIDYTRFIAVGSPYASLLDIVNPMSRSVTNHQKIHGP